MNYVQYSAFFLPVKGGNGAEQEMAGLRSCGEKVVIRSENKGKRYAIGLYGTMKFNQLSDANWKSRKFKTNIFVQ